MALVRKLRLELWSSTWRKELARHSIALTTEANTETPEPEIPEEIAPLDDDVEQERNTERYRKNKLLPKYAFLFPAKPRIESKELHLRSLRRSKFSTVACLDHQYSRKCAWCETETTEDNYFCPKCDRLLPVNRKMNLFQIFDIEPVFDVLPSQLDAKYKSLQLTFHPDRYATRDRLEQAFATAQATMINRAYQKLKQPLDRAKYLLSLKGFQFDKEQTISDPELLMEILDMQERVSYASNREELMEALSEATARKESLLLDIAKAFQDEQLKEASDAVIELSYIERIILNAKDRM